GIRGKDFGVVALGVRGLEISLETDSHRQFLDVVTPFLLRDPQQTNPRFAVIVCVQANRHASTPAIRGVPKWIEQHRNVIGLTRIAYAEDHANLRVKRLNL